MRGPIHQSAHVIYEVGYFLISLISRVINAVFYAGSMHQTFSARCHIEALDERRTADWHGAAWSDEWNAREHRINAAFFWQDNHCAEAWASEVTRARKTLSRNGDL
jgi:hypothetical protein